MHKFQSHGYTESCLCRSWLALMHVCMCMEKVTKGEDGPGRKARGTERQKRIDHGREETKLQQWQFWVLFGSDLVNLSDDVRERETEGKCSVSGDLKIYPPNLLSMDRAVASLQQIQHSLIAHEGNR